jgi:hypothetical protein
MKKENFIAHMAGSWDAWEVGNGDLLEAGGQLFLHKIENCFSGVGCTVIKYTRLKWPQQDVA